MRLRAGCLDHDERDQLANLLLQLAYGVPLSQATGVTRGRPSSPEHDEWVYEIATANLPKERGGEGKTLSAAIEAVADKYGKSFEAVEKAYKSRRGMNMRRAVKREIGDRLKP